MSVRMITLTDFLLARIAEDEEGIYYMVHCGDHSWWGADRMLAESEAKRRIVERCAEVMGASDPRASLDEDGWVSLMWEHMYDLASVYADHSDYRQEWAL